LRPGTIAGVHLTPKGVKDFKGHLESYEYPSIFQTADESIHAAYSFRRRTVKSIRFQEDWIKGGGTIGVFKAMARLSGSQRPNRSHSDVARSTNLGTSCSSK
jgi:hypothetical protein